MEEQEQQNVVNEEQQEINQVEPTPVSSPPSHKKLIIGIVVIFVVGAGFFLLKDKCELVESDVMACGPTWQWIFFPAKQSSDTPQPIDDRVDSVEANIESN